jgi:hypothetical protein
MTLERESDFDKILREELAAIRASERRVLLQVWGNRNDFIKWPKHTLLLWKGETNKTRYHVYPSSIVSKLKKANLTPNRLRNGPAIMAYRLAGGIRPPRRVGKQDWNIHHVYDGRFAFPPSSSGETLHAVKHGKHFTQAAGLVAIHPIAHACADEYLWFAWQLRHEAFLRFGYDPDGVFSARTDSMGFKTE